MGKNFEGRFDARGKRYLYLVATTRFRPPFGRALWHWVHDPLDLTAMRRAAALLRGCHDFSAFASSGSPRPRISLIASSACRLPTMPGRTPSTPPSAPCCRKNRFPGT